MVSILLCSIDDTNVLSFAQHNGVRREGRREECVCTSVNVFFVVVIF